MKRVVIVDDPPASNAFDTVDEVTKTLGDVTNPADRALARRAALRAVVAILERTTGLLRGLISADAASERAENAERGTT